MLFFTSLRLRFVKFLDSQAIPIVYKLFRLVEILDFQANYFVERSVQQSIDTDYASNFFKLLQSMLEVSKLTGVLID